MKPPALLDTNGKVPHKTYRASYLSSCWLLRARHLSRYPTIRELIGSVNIAAFIAGQPVPRPSERYSRTVMVPSIFGKLTTVFHLRRI